MLDLLFGLMLATSPLNDPMDDTALDKRGSDRASAAVATMEPAAGEIALSRSDFVDPVIARHGRPGGGER